MKIEKSLQELAMDFVTSRSERAFTTLYYRLRPGLKKFVQRYHTDGETVDEILSITLSKAFVFADKYDSRWNFSTWLYKICQNECLMEIRRKNAIYSLDYMSEMNIPLKAVNDSWKIEADYEYYEHPDKFDPEDVYDDVLEEIKNLPDHYKVVLQDRILGKMKYEDIAAKREIPINTVRTRIHCAKKVIKNRWLEKTSKTSKKIDIDGIALISTHNMHVSKPSKAPEVPQIYIPEDSSINYMITEAKYGAENFWIDVTVKLAESMHKNGAVKVSNSIGGDPKKGKKKTLHVSGIVDGVEFTKEFSEGTLLSSLNFC